MAKYLDQAGLQYLWTKIKAAFAPISHTHTASEVGLGNVTNDAQVKGLSTGTTSGHIVTWGADGYTVQDGGYVLQKNVLNTDEFLTQAEHQKLTGIESGAQVNIIEEILVNGSATTISGKTVDITIPSAEVTGVKSGDTILALSGTELTSTLSVAIEKQNDVDYIVLKGIGGAEIAKADASQFVVDGMLDNVTLSGNSLVFTFNTDAGKQDISVDLSKFIDVYSAGDGIEIGGQDNRTISVKLAQTQGNTELTFDANGGLKADVDLSDYTDSATTAQLEAALTAHTANTVIHVTSAQTAAWDAAQENVIEAITVNGSATTITNKTVDITVPEVGALTNAEIDEATQDS